MAKYIQLFRENKEILGSDGIMRVDGRLNNISIYWEVVKRNKRFERNFPHKIAQEFAVYSGRIGSNLLNKTTIKN
jgi:hypothetical protein